MNEARHRQLTTNPVKPQSILPPKFVIPQTQLQHNQNRSQPIERIHS